MQGAPRARAEQAASFLRDGQAQGIRFVTSMLAIEEAFHQVYMKFLRQEMRGQTPPLSKWKDLRMANRPAFDRALGHGRKLLELLDAYIKASAIDVLTFGRQPDGRPAVLEHQVISFVRACLSRYEVDCMDAFQFAAMRRFGIQHAASSDRDWLSFPSGTLFTAA